MYIAFLLLIVLCFTGCGKPEITRFTIGEHDEQTGFDDMLRWAEGILAEVDDDEFVSDLYEQDFTDAPPVVAPWTKVLDDSTVESMISLDELRIVFPLHGNENLLELELMDVIVSGHPEAPFLRRVFGIHQQDEHIIIETMEAGIADFMLAGSFSAPEEAFDEVESMVVDDVDHDEDSDLRQRNQELGTLGAVKSILDPEFKESQGLSVNFNMKLTGGTVRGRSKFELKFPKFKNPMCAEFYEAQTGVRQGRFLSSNTHRDVRVATLEWALKWAGYADRCLDNSIATCPYVPGGNPGVLLDEDDDDFDGIFDGGDPYDFGPEDYDGFADDDGRPDSAPAGYARSSWISGRVAVNLATNPRWYFKISYPFWHASRAFFNQIYERTWREESEVQLDTTNLSWFGTWEAYMTCLSNDSCRKPSFADWKSDNRPHPDAFLSDRRWKYSGFDVKKWIAADKKIHIAGVQPGKATYIEQSPRPSNTRRAILNHIVSVQTALSDRLVEWNNNSWKGVSRKQIEAHAYDIKFLDEAYEVLQLVIEDDDLHWIQLAPIVARAYCTGQPAKFELGAGMKVEIDYETSISVKYENKHEGSTSSKQNLAGSLKGFVSARDKEAEVKTEANNNLRTKHWLFWIGFVPVWIKADLTWSTAFKLGLKGELSYELKLPKKQAVIDFYYGFSYVSNRNPTSRWETLREYSGGRDQNEFNLFKDHPDSNGQPSGKLSHEVSAYAELSTGPKFMLYLYNMVGIGTQIGAKAGVKAGMGFEISESPTENGWEIDGIKPTCRAGFKAGITWDGIGEVALCPLSACKLGKGKIGIYDSCAKSGFLNQYVSLPCIQHDLITCASRREGGPKTQNASQYSCINCSTGLPPNPAIPEGINDVPGMYELDGLWLERNGRKILPVYAEGIANCTPERGTVERGCPELLWKADFIECDPDEWENKVALIPDLDKFRVRFREDAEEGDVLRVIRQAVRANEMNADGQRCQASGTMNFFVGGMNAEGNFMTGEQPVAEDIYNSGDFRVSLEHLSNEFIAPEESYWFPFLPDDDTYGRYAPGEEPDNQ